MGFQRVDMTEQLSLSIFLFIFLYFYLYNLYLSVYNISIFISIYYLLLVLFLIKTYEVLSPMLSFQPLSLLIHQQSWVQHWQFLLYKHFTWFSEPIPSLTSPPLPFRIHSLLTLRCLWLCVCDLLLVSPIDVTSYHWSDQCSDLGVLPLHLSVYTHPHGGFICFKPCLYVEDFSIHLSIWTFPELWTSLSDSWLIMSTWMSSSLIVTWYISNWVLMSTSTHNDIPSFCYSALPLWVLGRMGLVQNTLSF